MPNRDITYLSNKQNYNSLTGKTVVKLFTQDGVREMLIPSDKPNYHPMALSKNRLTELDTHAEPPEKRDLSREREILAKESRQRKERFKLIDDNIAIKSKKLSDLEEESKEKANYLLKRAWELRMEQEDEVKSANSLILKTKCQAIRDAQLIEKAEIRRKIKENDKAIEERMKEQRVKEMLDEKRAMDREKSKRDKYIRELNKQIVRSEQDRLLESEKLFQERKHLNEVMYMMMVEEIRKKEENEKIKAEIRENLAIANEQIRRAHAMEKEEARIADLKVQEWMKQRAEREEAQEKELAEAKRKREYETARLRAMQEKAGELQAQLDEMAAVRRQEEYEREWRKKEKSAAEKLKQLRDKCSEMRQKQLAELRSMQAMEIAREKMELERNAELQMQAEERERLEGVMRKKKTEEYREALLKQMNEKDAELLSRKKADLDEGIAVRAEVARHKTEIRRVLNAKLDQLRINKVPDIYVADVKRQLHLAEGEM